MRSDLNKLLCERERTQSGSSYEEHRRNKLFDERIIDCVDDEPSGAISGGHREGMKFRYGRGNKAFSENLRPLYGFIHKAVGRKWDDVYSEICEVFDKRSVINQHILLHLFQYVELQIVVIEGKLHVADYKYSWRGNRDAPLEEAGCEYYVDPRDGILKRNIDQLTRRVRLRREAKRRKIEKELSERREIDKETEYRKEDGIWYEVKYLDFKGEKVLKLLESQYIKNYYVTRTVYPTNYDVFRGIVSAPRVAVSKRQIGRQELRRNGLSND